MNPFVEKEELNLTEERSIHRITFPHMLNSLVDAFNLDRGLIYTLKRLYTVPGKMVQDYLYQGRYHYTPPFRMLLVSTTLVLLLIQYSKSGMELFQLRPEGATEEETNLARTVLVDYYNLFLWLFIPVLGFFSWLFNRRSRYNYAENLVFQTYLMVIGNILYVVMLLDHIVPMAVLSALYMLTSLTYSIIAYRQMFNKPLGRSILESLLIYILSMLFYGLLSSFAIGIYIGYMKASGA